MGLSRILSLGQIKHKHRTAKGTLSSLRQPKDTLSLEQKPRAILSLKHKTLLFPRIWLKPYLPRTLNWCHAMHWRVPTQIIIVQLPWDPYYLAIFIFCISSIVHDTRQSTWKKSRRVPVKLQKKINETTSQLKLFYWQCTSKPRSHWLTPLPKVEVAKHKVHVIEHFNYLYHLSFTKGS